MLSFILLGGMQAGPAVAETTSENGKNGSGTGGDGIDLTNLRIVESLDAEGKCLFTHGVYPAGGVGYEDSSLPYDGVEPISAALQTIRAQALRFHPESVMGLIGHLESESQRDAVIVLSASAAESRSLTIDELAKDDSRVGESISVLRGSGLTVRTEVRDVPSLLQLCQLEDVIHGLAADSGPISEVNTEPDIKNGVLRVRVVEEHVELIRHASAELGRFLEFVETSGSIDYGRTDDSAPWNGGNAVYRADGVQCSNAFRINGNGTLTAAHCGASKYHSPACWGVFCPSADYVGDAGYTLAGANVDAMVLHGSTYSRNVWVGGVSTSSALPGYGISPWYTMPGGSYFLISGSKTGQATVEYRGTPPEGCTTRGGYKYCHLISGLAPPHKGMEGDSGGPAAIYDSVNGRLIPLGVIQGGEVYTSVTHWMDVTNMQAIAYLYGGATIG